MVVHTVVSAPAVGKATAASEQFSGSAGTGDVGIVQVVVTATDADGLAVTDTFKITVSANTPPAYAASQSLANKHVEVGNALSNDLTGVFTDADGDSLTITAAVAFPTPGALSTVWTTFTSPNFGGSPSST